MPSDQWREPDYYYAKENKYFLPERDSFDASQLPTNEIRMGHTILARIPNIPGRITKKTSGGSTYIVLITERSYDPEKGQSRNKKVTIGTDASWRLPGMMLINERYHEFFDIDGNLVVSLDDKEEPKPEEPKDEKAGASREEANQGKTNPAETDSQETSPAKADKAADRIDAEITNILEKFYQQGQNTQTQPPEANTEGFPDKLVLQGPEFQILTEQLMAQFRQKLGLTVSGDDKQEKGKMQEPDRSDNSDYDDDDDEYEDDPESLELYRQRQEAKRIKDRFDLLHDLLIDYKRMVDEQAKRRPDAHMTLYQMERIEELLSEIRKSLSEYDVGDYLKPVNLSEEDPDGKIHTMTYGEMSILLSAYSSMLFLYKTGQLWPKAEE